MNYSEPRHLEIPISKDTVKELIAVHLQAMSYIKDKEDVIVDFNPKYLKSNDDETIPLALTISERNSKEEASFRINGKGEKL